MYGSMATARGGSVASELSIVLLKEIEKELEDVEVREQQQQQDGARRRLMTHSGYGSIPPSSREATRGNDDDDQSPLLADQSLADDVLIAEGEVKKQSRKFTTNQKLVLAAFCATNFCNFLVYSLIAPFFPNEVMFFFRVIKNKVTEKEHFHPIRSLKKEERQQWLV